MQFACGAIRNSALRGPSAKPAAEHGQKRHRQARTIVDGSGTALTEPPETPPSDIEGVAEAPPVPPNKLPLAATKELAGASEPASTRPPPVAAIGLPSGADGARVNVAPRR